MRKLKCELYNDSMQEEWRDVVGYEGFYQVSNLGNVRSVDRTVIQHRTTGDVEKRIKGKQLKKWLARNYYHVTFSRDGEIKAPFVHKLVAEAFIENKNNYPVVNHKDENTHNNHATNLEWCTQIYNRNYGHCEEKRLNSFLKSVENHKRKRKPVIQIDKNGNIVNRYYSMNAARKDGFNSPGIHSCCNGRLKTYKGYVWAYEE